VVALDIEYSFMTVVLSSKLKDYREFIKDENADWNIEDTVVA
jgi:hypothetical protein